MNFESPLDRDPLEDQRLGNGEGAWGIAVSPALIYLAPEGFQQTPPPGLLPANTLAVRLQTPDRREPDQRSSGASP